MLKKFLPLFLLVFGFALGISLMACSDSDSDAEFLFEREVTELKVLRECPSKADSGAACYQLTFRYPMDRENLKGIYMWVGDNVMDDTSKAASKDQIAKADSFMAYKKGSTANFDTIDLTAEVAKLTVRSDSLHVALFCEYDDGDDPGSVQHKYLHFGDDLLPSRVTVYDSVWATGALFEWFRPTDQTDFYKPMELSGKIVGYNVVIYALNKAEDIRNLKIKVFTADGVDSSGGKFFKRHARIRSNGDSVWVDYVSNSDNVKNYLRIAVLDGKGFDSQVDSLNRFRMIIEGLKQESKYTIGLSSWDSSGNSSGNEGSTTVDNNQLFMTTDSIAPLMPSKLFFMEDSLYPGYARLDSNNRVRIFWSRSVDPKKKDLGITVDSLITLPKGCYAVFCYDTVARYVVDRFDTRLKEWVSYHELEGSGLYSKMYGFSGDTLALSSTGTLMADTIRRVSPGDTLILRIRSVDSSGYYSAALVDTVYVSLGALSKKVSCPENFIAVSTSDTSVFCMEKLEHRVDSVEFARNVTHAEALAACEAIAAPGFKVSLCKERDWELVCLSGGSLTYGVLNEDGTDASEYLYSFCNVSTNDSISAADIKKREPRCVNSMGVRDLPGQYQEWVMGRSKDSAAVLKGASYKIFGGLSRESLAQCTNRSFPYYTRKAYTKDSVYLYYNGSKVDTVFAADTTRKLYKVLTQKDFKDVLQFFSVQDSKGNKLGMDYALYSEYKKGGEAWLKKLAGDFVYVPDHTEKVFLTGETVPYREVSSFYKSPIIGFRCCAYPE